MEGTLEDFPFPRLMNLAIVGMSKTDRRVEQREREKI